MSYTPIPKSKLKQMREEGIPVNDIARHFKVSNTTIYTMLTEIDNEERIETFFCPNCDKGEVSFAIEIAKNNFSTCSHCSSYFERCQFSTGGEVLGRGRTHVSARRSFQPHERGTMINYARKKQRNATKKEKRTKAIQEQLLQGKTINEAVRFLRTQQSYVIAEYEKLFPGKDLGLLKHSADKQAKLEQRKAVAADYIAGMPIEELCKKHNIMASTAYRWLRKENAELRWPAKGRGRASHS